MHQPTKEEHLIVLATPDEFNCGEKGIVERYYNPNLYTHPVNVEEVALTANGGLRLSVRLPEGKVSSTRAQVCDSCYTRILWNVIGRLKNRLDSLEHRVYALENPHSRFTE